MITTTILLQITIMIQRFLRKRLGYFMHLIEYTSTKFTPSFMHLTCFYLVHTLILSHLTHNQNPNQTIYM